MAAVGRVQVTEREQARRARGVWLVLTLSSIAFVLMCGVAAAGVSSYLSTVTTPELATVEVRPGTQVSVQRRRTLVSELVTARTELHEGDQVHSLTNSSALVQLFDGSTIQTYTDTRLDLETLRTSQFFQHDKEIRLRLTLGTAVIATAGSEGYENARYIVEAGPAELSIGSNSKVRLQVNSSGEDTSTQVVVDYGTAEISTPGRLVALGPGQMARVVAGTLEGPLAAEEELIRNGNFSEPPTSGAEEADSGGLGTAAWLPLRELSVEGTSDSGAVRVVSETVSARTFNAATFAREAGGERYARVGVRQDINRPVEFLSTIEFGATVKVVRQTLPSAGPQGNLFPITVKVIYTDSERNRREWLHSFYYLGDAAGQDGVTSKVEQGAWTSTTQLAIEQQSDQSSEFVLKSPTSGQDVAYINSIEIYGYGAEFQGAITDITLRGR